MEESWWINREIKYLTQFESLHLNLMHFFFLVYTSSKYTYKLNKNLESMQLREHRLRFSGWSPIFRKPDLLIPIFFVWKVAKHSNKIVELETVAWHAKQIYIQKIACIFSFHLWHQWEMFLVPFALRDFQPSFTVSIWGCRFRIKPYFSLLMELQHAVIA